MADQPQGQHEAGPTLSVLDHIAALKSGSVSRDALGTETILDIVEYLRSEGVGTSETAKLFRVDARTIRRDLQAVRERNAQKTNPGLVEEVAGELVVEARQCVLRIRRVTGDKDAPHAVRIDGERAVFTILDELAARLQSLGYLPTVTHRVQADLTHHLGSAPGLDGLQEEIDRLRGLVPEGSADAAGLSGLRLLTERVDQSGEPADNEPGKETGDERA